MSILINNKEKAEPAIPALLALFNRARGMGRFQQQKDILLTLSHLGKSDPQIVPLLVELWEENDSRFLKETLELTAMVGKPARPVLPFLQNFLKEALESNLNPDDRSREYEKLLQIAMIAIGEIGDPNPSLIEILQKLEAIKHPGFSSQARRILEKLGHEAYSGS